MMEEKLLICKCHNVEHQLIIYYDEEDNVAYIEFHLVNLPFLKRLKNAFRYLLGKKSMYGDFDELIIDEKYGEYFKNLGEKLIKNSLQEN